MNSFRVYNRIRRFARPPRIQSTRHIQPVFIIGSGRCGTTLLRRILSAGNEIYIPPETYVLGASIREFRSARFLVGWESLCRLTISNFIFSQAYETFPPSKLRPLLERMQSAPENERSCADLIHNLYLSWADAAKTDVRRWGDKTPANVFSLNIIDEAFPQARYVHMIRDGFDVVASMLNMGRYDSVDDAAKRWKQAIKLSTAFGSQRPERYKEVRYEEIVTNPGRTIRDVCEFLGMTYSGEMIRAIPPNSVMRDLEKWAHFRNVKRPIFTSSIGKGKQKLSEREMQRVYQIAGKEMRTLGYKL